MRNDIRRDGVSIRMAIRLSHEIACVVFLRSWRDCRVIHSVWIKCFICDKMKTQRQGRLQAYQHILLHSTLINCFNFMESFLYIFFYYPLRDVISTIMRIKIPSGSSQSFSCLLSMLIFERQLIGIPLNVVSNSLIFLFRLYSKNTRIFCFGNYYIYQMTHTRTHFGSLIYYSRALYYRESYKIRMGATWRE